MTSTHGFPKAVMARRHLARGGATYRTALPISMRLNLLMTYLTALLIAITRMRWLVTYLIKMPVVLLSGLLWPGTFH